MKKLLIILLYIFMVSAVYSQQIKVESLNINTSYDDFSPALTQHGTTFVMTSERNEDGQEIFAYTKMGVSYLIANADLSDINDSEHSGSATLTPDGQYMIFAAYEHNEYGEGRTDLYSARKRNGEWTDIVNLGPAVNSDFWDSTPCLTSDGRTLFFASDRPGGKGGVDIYYSRKTREGWTKAQNAGSIINTSSDELSPMVAADNGTFAFSSDRPGGLGKFDIYFANYTNNTFSAPRNAGAPVNTEYNEYDYFIHANTEVAYMSSDRSGGNGGLDIYTVIPNPHPSDAVVNLFGYVKDYQDGTPIEAELIITDLTSGEEIANLNSDGIDGAYYLVLQQGHEYSVTADAEGYVFYSEHFSLPKMSTGKDIKKDIKLYRIESGKTQLLIFFDYDKSSIKKESLPELTRVTSFLNKYSDVKISLEGHTDDVGSHEYNDKLSLDRAKTTKLHLINNGISESRIQTKGFGKRKPLVKETTDEARAINRRVEMIILE